MPLRSHPAPFGLSASGPNGQNESSPMSANPQGGQGEVTLSFKVDMGESNWTAGDGDWEITIHCGDCGNQQRKYRPGIIAFVDAGNDWQLSIEYTHYETENGGEEE